MAAARGAATIRVMALPALRTLGLALSLAAAVSGVATGAASAAGPPLLSRPAAAGRPYTGETVTLTPARWRTAADAVERTWIRCVRSESGGCRPQDIPGQTGSTYVITEADLAATVYAAERAHDVSGWSDWITSNSPGDDEMPQGVSPYVVAGPAPPAVLPRWTSLPTVTGTWQVGKVLSASTGAWTPPGDAFEYRWLRCAGGEDGEECEVQEIPGATDRTYELGVADEGTWPQVRVRAHSAGGWSPWAESLLERWDPVGERVAGGPASGGEPGAGGTTPPAAGTLTISRLLLKPTRFRAATRGASFGAGRGGTQVTVRVSAPPATLRFRVERQRGSRWVARGRSMRVTPRAPITATVRLRFSGRVSGQRLPAGSYRLRAFAVDAAGAESAARTTRFTIVR